LSPWCGGGTGFFVGTAGGRYSAAELAFGVDVASIVVDGGGGGSTDLEIVYAPFELCRA